MKKFFDDEKSLKTVKYTMLIVILSILFYKLIDHVYLFFNSLNVILIYTFTILTPFIYGAFMAYFLDPIITFTENSLYDKIIRGKTYKKIRRTLSIITVYSVILMFIVAVIINVLPQVQNIFIENKFSSNDSVIVQLENFVVDNNIISEKNINRFTKSFNGFITDSFFPDYDNETTLNTFNTIFSGLLNAATSFFTFLLGIIISIYILIDKKTILTNANKFLILITKDNQYKQIKEVIHDFNRVFKKFFIGKSIDSLIIGLICFIFLAIFQMPFALLISVIIGITNMIPYFGPIIGAVPSIIIVLASGNLAQVIWLIFFIFALQQFDGTILGPKILGDSLGLSPFWVIFSIIAGGAIFGVIGMFLGAPTFALIYLFISRYFNRKWDEKLKERKDG